MPATVSVEGPPEATSGAAPHDESRILHPVVEGRSRADPVSHTQRTGVVTLMDEDLLDWNIFLDRTSSTTALVLSVRVISIHSLCWIFSGLISLCNATGILNIPKTCSWVTVNGGSDN